MKWENAAELGFDSNSVSWEVLLAIEPVSQGFDFFDACYLGYRG